MARLSRMIEHVWTTGGWWAAAGVLLLAVGCGDGSPTAPTSVVDPTPQPQPPTPPTRPVEARFDDPFWRQFMFNQFDAPGTISWRTTEVLETTSPNVYIRMGDPTGRRVVSIGQRDHIRRAIPRLAEQLTGQPYRGRIEDGLADREQPGWITVRFVTQEEEPDISEGACARASVGADPGNIWIIRRARGNRYCVDERYFPEIFAHEFGHALGFSHVADRSAVMASGVYNGIDQFSAREVYHARLAYEVGRGQRYCGWPFGSTCFPPTALGAPTLRPGPPVIVID